jgi:nucleoside-diphosphate-sugar epimerase
MRLFITGGTGFLGSHFIEQSLDAGHDVCALRRHGASARIHLKNEPHWLDKGMDEIACRDMEGCDALIHFASHGVSPQKTDWESAMNTNVFLSTRLVQRAMEVRVPKILVCGSCFEFGRSAENYQFIPPDAPLKPIGPYASSKAAFSMVAESMAQTSDSEFVLLRPFHFYGNGQHEQNFWPSLRKAALSGGDFEMTRGEQIRNFQPVEQTAASFLKALDRWPGRKGRMFVANLGNEISTTLARFAQECWDQWDAKGRLRLGAIPYRPDEIMRYTPQL